MRKVARDSEGETHMREREREGDENEDTTGDSGGDEEISRET